MTQHPEQTLQEQLTYWLNGQLTAEGKRILWCASAGGMRVNMRTAINMKKAGYKAGHPDVVIYEPRAGWHGMTVELKVGSYPSAEQKEWRTKLFEQGYYAITVPGRLDFWEARKWIEDQIKRYLSGEIYASNERRIYKALKQRPTKEALKLVGKLKPGLRKE